MLLQAEKLVGVLLHLHVLAATAACLLTRLNRLMGVFDLLVVVLIAGLLFFSEALVG